VITCEEEARRWVASLPECDTLASERLECFTGLLRAENRKQNLVSAASLDAVWQRHIADSAQLLVHVPRGTGPWLDLGTGAGFPGLVASILRPECEFVLVESRARRVDWLERAAAELGLENLVVEGGRLESLHSRNVGVISARAFAPLEKLLSLSSRFSTSETLWLLPKGRSAQQELDELKGWRHVFHVEQSLTDPDSGIIVGKLTGRKGKSA